MFLRTIIPFFVFKCLEYHFKTIHIFYEFRFRAFTIFIFLKMRNESISELFYFTDLSILLTLNNFNRWSPFGSINCAISAIAVFSLNIFSSLGIPQYGVISPTILSAKSCTKARVINLIKVWSILCNCDFTSADDVFHHLPISMHLILSRPFVSSSFNRNVISPIRYIWPDIVSQSSTFRKTQPVRFVC